MEIGIITFHRAHNYGAVLQAYALQNTLKKMGYNVCILDYRSSYIEKVYSVFNFSYFLSALLHRCYWILPYPFTIKYRLKQKKNFERFQKVHLSLSNIFYDTQSIPKKSTYIIGSDQVWNPHLTNGIDNIFWGNFSKGTSHLISYAASTTISELQKIGKNRLQELLNNYNAISLREKHIEEYLQNTIGITNPIQVTLDPTLLTDEEDWASIINERFSKRNYVLIYKARDLRSNLNILKDKASIIASAKGWEVIDINADSYSVEDFVSLFKYAKCVITSSFHAVAFSIIFNRPLYAVCYNDGYDYRYANLLKSLDAENCLVQPDFEPSFPEIDYSNINIKRHKMRIDSLNYLRNNIL